MSLGIAYSEKGDFPNAVHVLEQACAVVREWNLTTYIAVPALLSYVYAPRSSTGIALSSSPFRRQT